jgi:hypothetical protein
VRLRERGEIARERRMRNAYARSAANAHGAVGEQRRDAERHRDAVIVVGVEMKGST